MKKFLHLIVILTVSLSVYSQKQFQTTSKSLNEKLNDLKLNLKCLPLMLRFYIEYKLYLTYGKKT